MGEKAGDKVLALALPDQVDVFDLIVASLKQVHRICQRLPLIMSVYHLAECVCPPNFLGIICNEESNSVGFDLHSTRVDLNFGLYRTFWTFKNVLQTN